MHPYYKIPPEVAESCYLTDTSPRHPDGWYLITLPKALRIAHALPPRPDGMPWDIPTAMSEVGAVGYDSSQAMASARGERAFRMDIPPEQPEPEQSPVQESEQPEQQSQAEAGLSQGEEIPPEELP